MENRNYGLEYLFTMRELRRWTYFFGFLTISLTILILLLLFQSQNFQLCLIPFICFNVFLSFHHTLGIFNNQTFQLLNGQVLGLLDTFGMTFMQVYLLLNKNQSQIRYFLIGIPIYLTTLLGLSPKKKFSIQHFSISNHLVIVIRVFRSVGYGAISLRLDGVISYDWYIVMLPYIVLGIVISVLGTFLILGIVLFLIKRNSFPNQIYIPIVFSIFLILIGVNFLYFNLSIVFANQYSEIDQLFYSSIIFCVSCLIIFVTGSIFRKKVIRYYLDLFAQTTENLSEQPQNSVQIISQIAKSSLKLLKISSTYYQPNPVQPPVSYSVVVSQARDSKLKPSQSADIVSVQYSYSQCLICCSQLSDSVFMPCGHSVICFDCSFQFFQNQENCPLCRSKIGTILQLQKSESDVHDVLAINKRVI